MAGVLHACAVFRQYAASEFSDVSNNGWIVRFAVAEFGPWTVAVGGDAPDVQRTMLTFDTLPKTYDWAHYVVTVDNTTSSVTMYMNPGTAHQVVEVKSYAGSFHADFTPELTNGFFSTGCTPQLDFRPGVASFDDMCVY